MERPSHVSVDSVSSVLNPTFQKTWVQCDNNQCKKWRRITNREAATITDETKWFCNMNEDISYNNCEYPEEDFQSAEDLAKNFGVKYITSPLCDGTIVWAKIDGYCRWPAIISMDPSSCQSSFQSIDGDTLCYHVEFLGKKHCHGVIRAPLVTDYVSVGKLKEMSPKLPADIRSKLFSKKKSLKTHKKNGGVGSSLKYEYQGGSVQTAIEEANRLLKLPLAERLNSVIYRPTVEPETPMTVHNIIDEDAEEKDAKGICRTPTMSPQMASLHLKKCFSSPAMSDRCGKRKRYVEGNGSSASLVNRSKEEKFTLDLQAYQRNEKAFEHDLKRYWDRMGQPLTVIPDWQGEPVQLFTVFSAVNDRGGFEQVSQTKGAWQKIYQEATNSNIAKQGVKAKTFYVKYLLPFQLYLQGKDYNEYLKYLRRTDDKVMKRVREQIRDDKCVSAKRRRTPEKSDEMQQGNQAAKRSRHRRKNAKVEGPTSSAFYDEDVGFSYILSHPPNENENAINGSSQDKHSGSDWKEIEEMLRSIPAFTESEETTQDNSQTHVHGQKNVEKFDSKMEVVFHEDDTPEFRERYEWEQGFQVADTNSEFGYSHLSCDGGQRVPSIGKSAETYQPVAAKASRDQVLVEMEAVQDEIGDIHKQLMML